MFIGFVVNVKISAVFVFRTFRCASLDVSFVNVKKLGLGADFVFSEYLPSSAISLGYYWDFVALHNGNLIC